MEMIPLLTTLYVTDSVPGLGVHPPPAGIRVLSVRPLLEAALADLAAAA